MNFNRLNRHRMSHAVKRCGCRVYILNLVYISVWLSMEYLINGGVNM